MNGMKVATFFLLIGSLMIVEARPNRHRRQAYPNVYGYYPSATAYGSNTLSLLAGTGHQDISYGQQGAMLHLLCDNCAVGGKK
jgi:hypothetical protein